jgi:serine/threonine protein kinase
LLHQSKLTRLPACWAVFDAMPSLGARDLIPRMLLVDPLKRITIPEVSCSSSSSSHQSSRICLPQTCLPKKSAASGFW